MNLYICLSVNVYGLSLKSGLATHILNSDVVDWLTGDEQSMVIGMPVWYPHDVHAVTYTSSATTK
jgi:hypothetical protein